MQESNEVYNLTPLEEKAVRKGVFSADNERSYSIDEAFDFARKHFLETEGNSDQRQTKTNSDLPKPSNKSGTNRLATLLNTDRGSAADGTGD